MPKYEYREVYEGTTLPKSLNKLGAEGFRVKQLRSQPG
jgi:hypothetical protein